VNDVDARGLGLIAGLVNRARGRGTIVSVMAASRVVQRLAEMTMIRASCGQAWLAALDDFRNWLIRAERV
jgi:ABC-type transporter Mla MlaB component